MAFDVVTALLQDFHNQGYSVLFDNLYSSPSLLQSLKDNGISETVTLRTNRRGIPQGVQELTTALSNLMSPEALDTIFGIETTSMSVGGTTVAFVYSTTNTRDTKMALYIVLGEVLLGLMKSWMFLSHRLESSITGSWER